MKEFRDMLSQVNGMVLISKWNLLANEFIPTLKLLLYFDQLSDARSTQKLVKNTQQVKLVSIFADFQMNLYEINPKGSVIYLKTESKI